ncbi:hypothetical protein NFI96_005811 [Prochilodus magdalenae]|nr:hypothetical protein NFI96_005811 [Prochilodus magdalenae]
MTQTPQTQIRSELITICSSCSLRVDTQCCPLDWTAFSSHCYYFSNYGRSWHRAQDECENMNAELLILKSNEEKCVEMLDDETVCDPVCVNVGGELYTTTLDTLTRCRDSMLGAMFTGQIPLLRDRNGNFFIDRDGKTFRYILNFLRCNSLDLPPHFTELTLLRREADFFQIRPLLEELERRGAEPRGVRSLGGALLCVEVDSQERVLHFNYKRKPENYELRSCTIRVHSAHIFCTSHALIQLLSSSFSYRTGAVSKAPQVERMDLQLEWVPCPPELPWEQHIRHGFRELSVTQQSEKSASIHGTGAVSTNSNSSISTHSDGSVSICDTRGFMAELLRVVMPEGFRIDLVSPDPSDVLNCQKLRCVRY